MRDLVTGIRDGPIAFWGGGAGGKHQLASRTTAVQNPASQGKQYDVNDTYILQLVLAGSGCHLGGMLHL